MRTELVIVHFHPVEDYPPVLNLLQVISENRKDVKITVLTNWREGQHYTFKANNNEFEIVRISNLSTLQPRWKRYFSYFNFYKKTYRYLCRRQPGSILYFDPISCVSVQRYFEKHPRSSTKLFIHHHEYVSLKEIETATGMMKWVYQKEKLLFDKAHWISQTNEERLTFFLQDQGLKKDDRFHIMPNWPIKKWSAGIRVDRTIGKPLKVVYVGALSLETMYIKEFAEWIVGQGGSVTWDVYSQQQVTEVIHFFDQLKSPYIHFRGHRKYDELPKVLEQYDVGVILYKGHIPNYIYNAPNKLFEYHVCGLDCWFPAQMVSAMRLSKTGSYPQIAGISFEGLHASPGDFTAYVERNNLPFKLNDYSAEKACEEIVHAF